MHEIPSTLHQIPPAFATSAASSATPLETAAQKIYLAADALREACRFSEAEQAFRDYSRHEPTSINARLLRANCLVSMGRLPESIQCLQEALHLGIETDHVRKNLGLAYLSAGELELGFKYYESRLTASPSLVAESSAPIWSGETFPGRTSTILLQCEQGIGDIIQFVRYAKLVQRQGFRVILNIYPQLTHLFRGYACVDMLVPQGLDLPAVDFRISLMSLPSVFRTTLETIPCEIPYLQADPLREKQWRERLKKKEGFRIGIAWQGNRKHPYDTMRSMPLASFEPVAKIAGVRLISLQKNDGVEQLREITDRFEVADLGERFDADPGGQLYLDTAAVMKSLDLVITCDTSMAHLAGALGVPVWMGVAPMSDWRWFRERPDSPWYPSMRIFRQRIPGDWSHVFQAMTRRLMLLDSYRRAILASNA